MRLNKKLHIFLLSAMLMAAGCNNKSDRQESTNNSGKEEESEAVEQPVSPEKPYPYSSGIIKYRYSGDYAGEQTVYFDNYGKRFRVEERYVNNAAPFKDTVDQVLIGADGTYYFINRKRNLGYKILSPEEAEGMQTLYLKDFTTIGIDSTMRKNGFIKKGIEEVEGKKCVVYASADGNSRFCFWQGININTEMGVGSPFEYSLKAVEITEDANIKENMFSPPSDVKFLEYEKYVEEVTEN